MERIPNPHYTLINTSRGDDPAVVVVNSALRDFHGRDAYPWHLLLTIDCKFVGTNGMPTSAEIGVLNALEDKISFALLGRENAVFLARVTCHGQRELAYRVRNPETAQNELQRLIGTEQVREWEYRMEHDPSWGLGKAELDLVGRDPRFN